MQHTEISTSVDNAADHVSKAWYPINKDLLDEIRSALKEGRYDGRIDPLVQDLKADASLYLLCLKKLSSLIDQAKAENGNLTPPKVFRQVGFGACQEVLLSDLDKDIPHRFENISELQAARVKECVVSASASEILAQDSAIDPELGFSCALLRQLGMTLIAWNYPHVYSRALQGLTPESNDLDLAIQKILGFSPSMLATSVAKRWGLSPMICKVIGEESIAKTEAPIDQENLAVSITLEKLCKIGEALARANDPEHYPSAMSDWENAESAIKTILGPNGIMTIQAKVEENLRAYAKRSPESFIIKITNDFKDKIENSNFAKKLLEENKYVELCPPLLKLQIKELYSSFSPHEISRNSIQKLTKDIIPCAGFDRGCVFMLEPATMSLVPLLKFGGLPENRTATVKVSAMNLDSNPVATAFRCNSPIKQIETLPDGTQAITLSGVLGVSQKVGVLYLEVSERLKSKTKADPELYFKAIKQCLSHCLSLR